MQPRNCVTVITQMLAHVPSDKTQFILDLELNREDASYKAPEETIQWFRTAQTLEKYISSPREDWEFEIVSIFTTMPVEALRKQYP